MANEIKPNSADSEERELGSAEGEEDVSEPKEGLEEAIPSEEGEYYKKLTGREDIETKEDFEKHYRGLISLVGQNPQELKEKAEAFDKIIEDANKIIDEAEATGELEKIEIPDEITELKRKVEETELLRSYPEIEKFIPTISSIADAEGISLKEAYEKRLKDLVISKLELEKAKEQEKSISVESKARISSTKAQTIEALVDRVIKEGTDEAKEALVREVFKE